MSEVIPFKKPKLSDKFKGRSLCREGFHKWVTDKGTRFDVKAGKLVTRYVCKRCRKVKTETH
jgi:hypothetical protein